ncbi:Cytosolic sulfotransferase 15 [Platanthera zijinensis]|uniref:Sulfotransferase n=1 Tax=Platanthera zijinensis TaxID=2320716 RepID=A0AAP0C525_9ASPA
MFSHPYIASCFETPKTEAEKYEEAVAYQHRREEISNLPVDSGWGNIPGRLYKGFWFPEPILYGVLSLRRNFRPAPSDIFLATCPKSGTTWLKALAFVICSRGSNGPQSMILSRNPHDCYPNIENFYIKPQVPDLDAMPSPRLMATHTPYSLLPESVRDEESPSCCRIIYLCREPKDTLVSTYHFANGISGSDESMISMAEAVELFCKGHSPYGPVWEHQLEYWAESRRRPDKVLFLKYEDLKAEPEANVRMMARFMGRPITAEEEADGTVAEIVGLCSFEKLSGLEVNRVGVRMNGSGRAIKNSLHFRKGKVGDWREHLSPEMADKVDAVTRDKLNGTGLSHCNLEPPARP